MKLNKKILIFSIISFVLNLTFAEISFNGVAGGKLDFEGNNKSDTFEPVLNMQSFFAGQFGFSEDVIMHAEFSVCTPNLISSSIFKKTDAEFQIDELSLVIRRPLLGATNYFSIFAGTYEPIGSDIFLRRQFGIQSVQSKITENWLGLNGSVIYPLFGTGISDIIHFDTKPIATGFYTYVNHELDDCYVFNFDYRFSFVYRLCALDISSGLGLPLKTNSNENAFIVVDTLYWRAGINFLIGNSHTTSLFIQAGISAFPFKKQLEQEMLDVKKTYLLFEPRFKTKRASIDWTVYSLPQETVDSFVYLNDTLGTNINIYTDDLHIKNQTFIFGFNTGLSFPDKTFMDLSEPDALFVDLQSFNVTVSPYLKTRIFNGDLNAMVQVRIMDMINGDWYKGFEFSLGFKTQL